MVKEKCYQAGAAHRKQYLHPGDVGDDKGKGDSSKTTAKPKATPKAAPVDLDGKKVVFTGKLTSGARRQAENKAQEYGCFIGVNVSKNTDYVIEGDGAGSKLIKAKMIGTKVLSEDDWHTLLKKARKVPKEDMQSQNVDMDTDTEDEIESAKKDAPKPKKQKSIPKKQKSIPKGAGASTKTRVLHSVSMDSDDEKKAKKIKKTGSVKRSALSDSEDEESKKEVKKLKKRGSVKRSALSDSEDESSANASPKKKAKKSTSDDEMEVDEESPKKGKGKGKGKASPKKGRVKCQYWAKCFRKDVVHLMQFLHPGDEEGGSGDKADSDEDDDGKRASKRIKKQASDAAKPKPAPPGMKPRNKFDVGDEVDIDGETNTHRIKRTIDAYYCTCAGWKLSHKSVDMRTCRHLRQHLGVMFENARCSEFGTTVNITRAQRHKAIKQVLLAHKWSEKVDPTGWWMSEKLDGVRAFWDGKTFYSRLGNEFIPPPWFIKGFPSDMELDGELFGGRGMFQSTVSIVKNPGIAKWKELQYHIFDSPSLGSQPFEKRIATVREYFEENGVKTVKVLSHDKCKGIAHMKEELAKVEAKGGEGLMIRKPKSQYEHCRSQTLLKIKTFHDAEAEVIGHETGKGVNQHRCGALRCVMECGKEFSVGSGLTNKDRNNPPKIGSIITYKFQELTNSGSPRFPTYIGVRIDADGPKDADIGPKITDKVTDEDYEDA